MRRSAMMGFPVTAWNTHKALTFDAPPAYHDDVEDTHALAQNVLNNIYRVRNGHPLPRRVLELEVVEHSVDLLDEILDAGDVILIQMIEAAYLAACRQREKRFGEAVILAWGVCEQLIFAAWNKLLDDAAPRGAGPKRMSKSRRKKN